MDDNKIIQLLFERSENALNEVSYKYSRLYKGVIKNILSDEYDIDECENDILLAVWNSIPPHCPNSLAAYLCKLARNIGVDKLRCNTRLKRNSQYTVMLSELNDCIPSKNTVENTNEDREVIISVLSEFLSNLEPETEILFVRRYIYLDTISSLAQRFEFEENYISVKLYRARKKLKKMLLKGGVKV